MVKFSEKKSMLENFCANVLKIMYSMNFFSFWKDIYDLKVEIFK